MTYSKSRKQTLFKHLRKYFSAYDIEVVAMEDFGDLPYSFKLLSLNVPLTADNKWRVLDATTKGDLKLTVIPKPNGWIYYTLAKTYIQRRTVQVVQVGLPSDTRSCYNRFAHKDVVVIMDILLSQLPS
jgi:hypothetical protein